MRLYAGADMQKKVLSSSPGKQFFFIPPRPLLLCAGSANRRSLVQILLGARAFPFLILALCMHG